MYIRSSREKVLLSHPSKQAGSLNVGMSQNDYRSTIPITLRYNKRSVKIKALVDSGADFCMFDGELLNLLAPDLNLTTLEKISLGGVGGTATGYVVHIEIGVNNTFFPVPAVFSFEFSPDEFGGLADQLGFFDTYIVEFNRKAMSVVLN